MLQMDMTAWVKRGTEERVGIIQDFVDPSLTSFIEELIGEYREPASWHAPPLKLIIVQSTFRLSRPSVATPALTTPASAGLATSLPLREYELQDVNCHVKANRQYREHVRGLEPQHPHLGRHHEPPGVLF